MPTKKREFRIKNTPPEERKENPSVTELAVSERRRKCLELRVQGHSQHQIAEMMGVSQFCVSTMITEMLEENKKVSHETAAQIVHMELMGLDEMQLKLNQKLAVIRGAKDMATITGAILGVKNQRARYLGLYEPEKFMVKKIIDTDTAIATIVQQARAKREAIPQPDDDSETVDVEENL